MTVEIRNVITSSSSPFLLPLAFRLLGIPLLSPRKKKDLVFPSLLAPFIASIKHGGIQVFHDPDLKTFFFHNADFQVQIRGKKWSSEILFPSSNWQEKKVEMCLSLSASCKYVRTKVAAPSGRVISGGEETRSKYSNILLTILVFKIMQKLKVMAFLAWDRTDIIILFNSLRPRR